MIKFKKALNGNILSPQPLALKIKALIQSEWHPQD